MQAAIGEYRSWRDGASRLRLAGRAPFWVGFATHGGDSVGVRVLAELAMDVTVAPSERRRAAMDLIAVGSGRPALVQEVVGQGGSSLGPLLNFNIGMFAPEQAYHAFVEGKLPIEPALEAIQGRPAIEAVASPEGAGAAIESEVERESGSIEAAAEGSGEAAASGGEAT